MSVVEGDVCDGGGRVCVLVVEGGVCVGRGDAHTSELQSRTNLVCCLLLEKNKYDLPVGSV